MQQIKSGKVILLPKKTVTDNQLALKVKSVTDAGNGMLQIIGETPDISEVYQKVDIQKEKQADMSMFVPNEDVVASVRNVNSGLKGTSIQSTVSAESGKIVELKEQKIGTVGTFSGSVELSAPKVTAIVDADFSKRLHLFCWTICSRKPDEASSLDERVWPLSKPVFRSFRSTLQTLRRCCGSISAGAARTFCMWTARFAAIIAVSSI